MEPTTFGAGEIAFRLAAVLALVFANGFFVAAEFSLVTVRKTRIDQLIAEGSSLARPVRRAISEPDSYIAATQLAITMSSLGLGWIGALRPPIPSRSPSRSHSSRRFTSSSASSPPRRSRSSTPSAPPSSSGAPPRSSCACSGRSSPC
jgi:hypothetical protein